MAEETSITPALNVTRTDDFVSLYANNIQFEQSAFDLKLVLGELDQPSGNVRVKQHSSVTIPWAQAKLLVYYLQVHIAAYEFQMGKIKIRQDLVPPPIPISSEQKDDPKMKVFYELISNIREQFVSGL